MKKLIIIFAFIILTNFVKAQDTILTVNTIDEFIQKNLSDSFPIYKKFYFKKDSVKRKLGSGYNYIVGDSIGISGWGHPDVSQFEKYRIFLTEKK